MEVDKPADTIDVDNIDVSTINRKRNIQKDSNKTTVNGIEGTKNTGPASKKPKLEHKLSKDNVRRISIPAHRLSPLRENWLKIFKPITEQLLLWMKFNKTTRIVELKTHSGTKDIGNLQKAADFVKVSIDIVFLFLKIFDCELCIAVIVKKSSIV